MVDIIHPNLSSRLDMVLNNDNFVNLESSAGLSPLIDIVAHIFLDLFHDLHRYSFNDR